jgi:hypothetical protein
VAEIVFAVPVLPGKEELDRQTMDEMAESRRDEYEAAVREAGRASPQLGSRRPLGTSQGAAPISRGAHHPPHNQRQRHSSSSTRPLYRRRVGAHSDGEGPASHDLRPSDLPQ